MNIYFLPVIGVYDPLVVLVCRPLCQKFRTCWLSAVWNTLCMTLALLWIVCCHLLKHCNFHLFIMLPYVASSNRLCTVLTRWFARDWSVISQLTILSSVHWHCWLLPVKKSSSKWHVVLRGHWTSLT